MKILYFFLVILIYNFPYTAAGQSLFFYKERIEVTVHPGYCSVRGIYYFRNTTEISVNPTIFYPFSNNYSLSKADSVQVYDLDHDKAILFSNGNDHILFNLNIRPEQRLAVKVYFIQKTPKQAMEYILLTTKKWRRPFEKAEYIIHIDERLNLKKLSLQYDYKKNSGDFTTYFISKSHYMPDKNLLIKWEDKQ